MILDNVEETFPNDKTRELGLAFIKGSSLKSFIPGEYEEIISKKKNILKRQIIIYFIHVKEKFL